MTTTTKKTQKKTAAKGASLVPDLEKNRASVTTLQWFWIGALPGCPRESLDLAGISFPKMTEMVRKDPHQSGKTHRTAKLGALIQLTEAQVERLIDRMPFQVIRFDDTPEEDEAKREQGRQRCDTEEARATYGAIGGAGAGIEALDVVRRKGHPIRIPSPEDIAKAKKAGKTVRAYTQGARDEPAARYLFAELCESQTRPQRSDFYPDPLEVTGLEWPSEE